MFVHLYSFGIGIFAPSGFARYENGNELGPHTIWFDRKCFVFYWAVTPPRKKFGYLTFRRKL